MAHICGPSQERDFVWIKQKHDGQKDLARFASLFPAIERIQVQAILRLLSGMCNRRNQVSDFDCGHNLQPQIHQKLPWNVEAL